jgi:hypothetical protein
MYSRKPSPGSLQQQPVRRTVQQQQQQQQSGSNEFQSKPGAQEQMGEGSYEGSRQYKERTEEYLKKNEVEADAEAAKPRSEQEAREMEEAEKEGRSHSKGER